MITHPCRSGDVVKGNDGRLGLVTGWIGDGDHRECGVIMRRGEDQPFDQFWIPIASFVLEYSVIGKFETAHWK
jgi:hypothetical protein